MTPQAVSIHAKLPCHVYRSNRYYSADQIKTDFTLNIRKRTASLPDTNKPLYKHQTNNQLARIQNKPFSSIGLEDDDVFADVLSNMYVHLFAAVNISQGDFNNIYWTNMAYLGSIKIR